MYVQKKSMQIKQKKNYIRAQQQPYPKAKENNQMFKYFFGTVSDFGRTGGVIEKKT